MLVPPCLAAPSTLAAPLHQPHQVSERHFAASLEAREVAVKTFAPTWKLLSFRGSGGGGDDDDDDDDESIRSWLLPVPFPPSPGRAGVRAQTPAVFGVIS